VCAFTLIPALAAAVLRLGVTSIDFFGDPANCGILDSVRGLYGD
jgi:hypothetical protein